MSHLNFADPLSRPVMAHRRTNRPAGCRAIRCWCTCGMSEVGIAQRSPFRDRRGLPVRLSRLTRIGVIKSLSLKNTNDMTTRTRSHGASEQLGPELRGIAVEHAAHCRRVADQPPLPSPIARTAERSTPFQPAPYSPVANRPTEITPHRPLTPWTEIAPTTSSTPMRSRRTRSRRPAHRRSRR